MDLQSLRLVARQEATVFGGTAKVNEYTSDQPDLTVNILAAQGSPEPGLTSYGTIGMSAFDSGQRLPTGPIAVELVGAAQDRWTAMPNGLASCAFNLGKGQYGIKPEVVFPRVFADYQPEVTTLHALMWQPFLWSTEFEDLTIGSTTVTWLMVIPITDSEFAFVGEHGVSRFIDELERVQPDTYDMSREGIV